MKTKLIPFLAVVLMPFTQIQGQDFEFNTNPFDQSVGSSLVEVSVECSDKNPSPDIKKKMGELKTAFEKAIATYTSKLDSELETNAPGRIKKVLGTYQAPRSLFTVQNINIAILVLDRGDEEITMPTTYVIPSFSGAGQSFVVHVPYSFLDRIKDPKRLEHVAFHEIGHIIADDFDQSEFSANLPEKNSYEKERLVECLVYMANNEGEYKHFLRAWLMEDHPDLSKQDREVTIIKWILNLQAPK